MDRPNYQKMPHGMSMFETTLVGYFHHNFSGRQSQFFPSKRLACGATAGLPPEPGGKIGSVRRWSGPTTKRCRTACLRTFGITQLGYFDHDLWKTKPIFSK